MSTSINTDFSALRVHRQLLHQADAGARAIEKLSTGLKINRAADDPTGAVISEGLRATVTGVQQALRNIESGFALIDTADGALSKISDILQRMRELALQGANGTYAASDSAALAQEFAQLKNTVSDIANNTMFGNIWVFAGDVGTLATGAVPYDFRYTTLPSFSSNLTFNYNKIADLSIFSATASNETVPSVTLPGPPPTTILYQANAYAGAVKNQDFTITFVPHGRMGQTQLYDYTVTLNLGFANKLMLASPPPPPLHITAGVVYTYPTNVQPLKIDIQVGARKGQVETISLPYVDLFVLGIANSLPASLGMAQSAIKDVDKALSTVNGWRAALAASYNRLECAKSAQEVALENQASFYSRVRDADIAEELSVFSRTKILISVGTAMIAQAERLQRASLKRLA